MPDKLFDHQVDDRNRELGHQRVRTGFHRHFHSSTVAEWRNFENGVPDSAAFIAYHANSLVLDLLGDFQFRDGFPALS